MSLLENNHTGCTIENLFLGKVLDELDPITFNYLNKNKIQFGNCVCEVLSDGED
jgi:hypothetical protein